MIDRPIPVQTIERQMRASDPETSAWVSANAGSGKTHVLAQRVVRLLLDQVPPSRILCLTFTKAAAANMSMRVFRTLSEWTRLDDLALERAIVAIGAPRPDKDRLVTARRLFAQAVETPGGLKIETLHAFCERLLHLFPFEANVPAGFEVIEESEQAEMIATAREAALTRAMVDAEGALGLALSIVAQETSEGGFEAIIGEALKKGALMTKVPAVE
jgi:ATP-dependent helicase/nuclease subunit A